MKILMTRVRNSRGMTLIEILIVMAIIGALLAVLLPNIMGKLDKSKVSNTKIAITQMVNALNLYYTDCGKYPSSIEGLTKADPDCSNWGPEPYLKKPLKDAWNRDFIYSIEGNAYTIKSLGKDGREGGDGFDKDISQDDVN